MKTWFPFTLVIALLIETAHPRLAAAELDAPDAPAPSRGTPGSPPPRPPAAPRPPGPPAPAEAGSQDVIEPVPPAAPSPGRSKSKARASSVEVRDEMLDQARDAVGQARIRVMDALKGAESTFVDLEELRGDLGSAVERRMRTAASRTLVVPGDSADPAWMAEADEDLNIMSRLLAKALTRKGGEDPTSGVAAKVTSLLDRSRAVRHLHIQGQGALFLFRVSFALLGPPAGAEAGLEKPAKASAWDDTRQELYGTARDSRPELFEARSRDEVSGGERYDAERVEMLTGDLVEALRHAANMRHLGPGETVTVIVMGPAPAGPVKVAWRETSKPAAGAVDPSASSRAGGGAGLAGRFMAVREDAASRGTTLLVRATRGDIQAFSDGKLTAAEFRKRVKVMAY